MRLVAKALQIFSAVALLTSGSALAAGPIRLSALIALMDRVQPDADDGWSTEVTTEVCVDFDPQVVLKDQSPWPVRVDEKKVGGEHELHIGRSLWFLRSQKLVVSGYQDGNCAAWIYVKPPLS